MTAFECDEPSDFMHLMLTLRESEASAYTERTRRSSSVEGMRSGQRSTRSERRLRPVCALIRRTLVLLALLALAGCGGDETAAPTCLPRRPRASTSLANVLQPAAPTSRLTQARRRA
jgi:hypothetical protein